MCDTEQPEIDRLRDAADAVLDAQFISTAGETAIARYEKIFGITPMDTDTLDERGLRCSQRSMRSCRSRCAACGSSETLCGADGYKLELDGGKYTLTVKVALTAKRNQQAVEELLPTLCCEYGLQHHCCTISTQT
ncbi:MAG: putative phage tail protein [Butyricicoccus sp.]